MSFALVIAPTCSFFPAAPETEDLELGNANSKVLTDNVGDGEATEDPDALDSDYEDDEDIGEMFVDREEDSDGEYGASKGPCS